MSCKLRKNTWGPNSPLFRLYFKDCVMITNVWFWYFLSSILKIMGIYIGCPPPVRVFEKFRSLFLSSFFFPFLFFTFIVCLSGASLAPGPLDNVHPCHPVATPLLQTETPSLRREPYLERPSAKALPIGNQETQRGPAEGQWRSQGAGATTPLAETLPPLAPNEITLCTEVYGELPFWIPVCPPPAHSWAPLPPPHFEKSGYAPAEGTS